MSKLVYHSFSSLKLKLRVGELMSDASLNGYRGILTRSLPKQAVTTDEQQYNLG